MTVQSPRRDVVANSQKVAVWTLASRLTGLVRVVAISMVLGATHTGNLFQLANQFPWVLYELAAGSLIASLVVPALVAADGVGGGGARRLIAQFTTSVLGLFAAIGVLAAVASPLLIGALDGSVPAGSAQRYAEIGVLLILITSPQLIGYGMIAVSVAAQNARGRFAFAAAAPAIENLIVIGGVLVYYLRADAGAEIGVVGRSPLMLLAATSTAAVAVHVLIQSIAAHRVGLGPRLTLALDSAEFRSIRSSSKAAGATAALAGVRHLVLLLVSGTVAGGIVAYQLAVACLNLPIALGARPVATAGLPVLSELAVNNDKEGFARTYVNGIALASVVVIPAAIGIGAFSPSLANGLAFGELSNDYGRSLLLAAVAGIAVGVVGEALYQMATHGSYARLNPSAPLGAMAIRAGLAAASAVLLLSLDLSPFRLVLGIGVLVSLSDLVGAFYVHHRVIGWAGGGQTWSPVRSFVTSAGLIVPVSLVTLLATNRWPDPPVSTALVAAGGALGCIGAIVVLARANPEVGQSFSQLSLRRGQR